MLFFNTIYFDVCRNVLYLIRSVISVNLFQSRDLNHCVLFLCSRRQVHGTRILSYELVCCLVSRTLSRMCSTYVMDNGMVQLFQTSQCHSRAFNLFSFIQHLLKATLCYIVLDTVKENIRQDKFYYITRKPTFLLKVSDEAGKYLLVQSRAAHHYCNFS